MKTTIDVHIRWMVRRDMPEVYAIERYCFEFPWPDEDFIRAMRQSYNVGMVAEHRGKVVGFMIYRLEKTKLHVINFAVHPDYQRKSVGSQMCRKLIGKLCSQRRTRITLEIRETNLDAQLFFRELGFKALTILRDFYDDTDEDAYLMQYRLEQHAQAATE